MANHEMRRVVSKAAMTMNARRFVCVGRVLCIDRVMREFLVADRFGGEHTFHCLCFSALGPCFANAISFQVPRERHYQDSEAD
jgi:hypothetical protein